MAIESKEEVMEAKASARHVRVSPQKARRVVDLIRGKAATDAVTVLHLRAAVGLRAGQEGARERHRQRPRQGRP